MKFTALMLTLAAIACITKSTNEVQRCVEDDNAIIAVALQHEVSYGARLSESQVLVIYDTTVKPRRKAEGDISDYFRGPAGHSLAQRNVSSVTLSGITFVERVRFVRQDERRALFPKPATTLDQAWRDFYSRFPDAGGLINVSLPGYDMRRCEALLYIERQGGPLAAEGAVLRLMWRDGQWIVVDRQEQWVS